MTDANDEHGLIAAARRGLSPTAADRERVRRALGALAPVATAPSGHGGGAVAARAASRAMRLVAVGLVAATAGGVGYLAGYRAGRRQAGVESGAPAIASVAHAPAPAEPPAAAPGGPHEGSDDGRAVAAASVEHAARPASRRRALAEAAPSPETPADASASLAKELQTLRAVERALREGNPGFALSLLRELDRAVPNGRLQEERLATLTIARCTTGDVPLGVDLAQDFAERYPDSVYGRRVFDACAGTDSSPAGDSPSKR